MPPEIGAVNADVVHSQAPHYGERLSQFFPKLQPYLAYSARWIFPLMEGVAKKYPEEVVDHSVRTALHAHRIAKDFMNVDFLARRPLIEAMLTHDVGKEAITEEIIKGKKGQVLTDTQWAELRSHAELSVRAVAPFSLPAAYLIEAVHRQGRPGSTYPNEPLYDYMGQESSHFHPMALDILGVTKLTTLCDNIDALRSPRSYKEPKTKEETIEIILGLKDMQGAPLYNSERGIELVTQAVDWWDEVNAEFKQGKAEYLKSEEVLSQGQRFAR